MGGLWDDHFRDLQNSTGVRMPVLIVVPQVNSKLGLFPERQHFSEKNMIFKDFQMFFHQNGPNLLLTRGTTIKTGILTPIEFWWVPQIPEMVVPESAHDRSCSKVPPKNVPSAITIPESNKWDSTYSRVVFFVHACIVGRKFEENVERRILLAEHDLRGRLHTSLMSIFEEVDIACLKNMCWTNQRVIITTLVMLRCDCCC